MRFALPTAGVIVLLAIGYAARHFMGGADDVSVVAWLAFIAALLTAISTLLLYKEAHETRVLQLRPHVSVTFEPRANDVKLIDVRIANEGMGPALDVEFEIQSGDFIPRQSSRRKSSLKASNYSFFRQGSKYIGPSQIFRTLFTTAAEVTDLQRKNEEFTVVVRFKDLRGKAFKMVYRTDFSEFLEFSHVRTTRHSS